MINHSDMSGIIHCQILYSKMGGMGSADPTAVAFMAVDFMAVDFMAVASTGDFMAVMVV